MNVELNTKKMCFSLFSDGYAISPKNCQIATEKGTCMFVWECLKTDGKHLGMCMDGFMFGSCCVHDDNNNQVNIRFLKLVFWGFYIG
jgi:hypothetical protein